MEILQNIGLTLCGSIFLLFTIIGYIKSKKKKSYESTLFLLMVISITIATLCEFLFSFLALKSADNVLILNVLTRIYIFMTMLWLNALTVYLVICSNKELFEKNKKLKLISIILFLVVTIIPFIIKNVLSEIPIIAADNTIHSINAIYGHPTHFCAIPIALVTVLLFTTSLRRVIKTLKIPFFGTVIILLSEIVIKLFVHTELNELTFLFQLITVMLFLTSESANVRMIKEINESKQKSEIALDGQNEFISSMSHDIRTPLGAIIGMSEVLINEEGLTLEKTKEELTNVVDASEKLTELMTNLIDIASINEAKNKIQNSVFIVKNLAENINTMLSYKAPKKNCTFTTNINDRMPSSIIGDYDKINRSILLLCDALVCKTENGTVNINYFGEVRDDIYMLNINIEAVNTKFSNEDFNIDFNSYMSLYTDKINTIDSEKLGVIISKNYIIALGGNINYSTLENGNKQCSIVIPVQLGREE